MWQQKTQLAGERARNAHPRVHTREKVDTLPPKHPLGLWPTIFIPHVYYWVQSPNRLSPPHLLFPNSNFQKNKSFLSLFRAFTSLFGNDTVYTYRGATKKRATHFISFFTAKAHTTYHPKFLIPPQNMSIGKLNPNRSLDRYSAKRYGEENFLSSFIFLLASCCSFVLNVAR